MNQLTMTQLWGYWTLEAKLLRSAVGPQLCTAIGQPAFFLIAFTIGFGGSLEGSVDNYQSFLAIGAIGMAVIHSTAYMLMYRFWVRLVVQKNIDAVLVTPITPAKLVVFQVLWSGATGAILSAFPLAGLAIFQGTFDLRYLLVILLVGFTALVYSAVGLLVASWVKNIDSINYVATLVFTPMFLIGGTFFPVDRLPGWLNALNVVNPVYYLLSGARELLSGNWPAYWSSLGVLALAATVAIAVSAAFLTVKRKE